MDGARLDAVAPQTVGQLVHADLRPPEDERTAKVHRVVQVLECVELVPRGHLAVELPDRLDRLQLRGSRFDALRVTHVAPHQPADAHRHRRAEERRLPVERRLPQDLVDVLGEPDVEHLVRLVQHDETGSLQRERPPAQVVDHAPRCAHDHVAAPLERFEVAVDGLAAHQPDGREAVVVAEVRDDLGHLVAQLPCRDQHEALDLVPAGVDRTRQRLAEGERLARSRLCEPDHVAPLVEERQ